MKAPLSQTLFLTEDGSTIQVAVATAVTIPPLVPTPPTPPPSTYQMDFRQPANARLLGATL